MCWLLGSSGIWPVRLGSIFPGVSPKCQICVRPSETSTGIPAPRWSSQRVTPGKSSRGIHHPSPAWARDPQNSDKKKKKVVLSYWIWGGLLWSSSWSDTDLYLVNPKKIYESHKDVDRISRRGRERVLEENENQGTNSAILEGQGSTNPTVIIPAVCCWPCWGQDVKSYACICPLWCSGQKNYLPVSRYCLMFPNSS